MKAILTYIILIFSISSLNATVYETVSDGNWNSPNIWNPSIPNPSWSNTNDTIIIKHDVIFNTSLNLYGQTFIIESTALLLQSGNRNITLTNGSDIIIDGSMEVNDFTVNWNSPSVEVNGDLSVNNLVINTGEFDNSGNITIDGYLKNIADLINSGSITVSSYLENAYTTGDINNSGYIQVGSNLLNNNLINNNGTIEVIGSLTNTYSSNLTTTGVLLVSEDFLNQGVVFNTNYIDVDGSFTSVWGTSVTNYGVMEVEEDLTNQGNFVNDGDLTVDGTADSPGGAITGDGNICSTSGTDPTGTGTIENDVCGGDDVALPVELIEFKAEYNNDIIVLNWITASEFNNDYFEIQYSENAEDFKSVKKIQGAGNSNQTIEYNAEIDDKFESGIYYFRLMQVDFNGTASFSEIKTVEVNSNLLNAKIYPTPANTIEEINIEFDEITEVQVELYSLNGKLLYQDIRKTNNYNFNSIELDNANYIVRIISGEKIFIGKIHIIP